MRTASRPSSPSPADLAREDFRSETTHTAISLHARRPEAERREASEEPRARGSSNARRRAEGGLKPVEALQRSSAQVRSARKGRNPSGPTLACVSRRRLHPACFGRRNRVASASGSEHRSFAEPVLVVVRRSGSVAAAQRGRRSIDAVGEAAVRGRRGTHVERAAEPAHHAAHLLLERTLVLANQLLAGL